jgi:hypothetical protein
MTVVIEILRLWWPQLAILLSAAVIGWIALNQRGKDHED